METPDVEALAREARRRALLIVIRSHPEWTLAQVLASSEDHAQMLASLTLRELAGSGRDTDGRGPAAPTRYERAQRCQGRAFAELVLEVMVEAREPVQTRYLRARLGGPRWKVKGALERLCAEGRVLRVGVTSDTYYELAPPERELVEP